MHHTNLELPQTHKSITLFNNEHGILPYIGTSNSGSKFLPLHNRLPSGGVGGPFNKEMNIN
jgi:hypothetical protein